MPPNRKICAERGWPIRPARPAGSPYLNLQPSVAEAECPFTAVMEHVDVYVTNGGFGGVMIALTNGVPVVVAGTTEDKAEVAARIAHRELGIRLRTSTPRAAAVRGAVRTLLDDPGYTERAARVGKLLRGQDAPTNAVRLLARLADTGEPVVAAGR
jgi:UDP:flavonoid glycosyltransferase YjiC (YdhE family)